MGRWCQVVGPLPDLVERVDSQLPAPSDQFLQLGRPGSEHHGLHPDHANGGHRGPGLGGRAAGEGGPALVGGTDICVDERFDVAQPYHGSVTDRTPSDPRPQSVGEHRTPTA